MTDRSRPKGTSLIDLVISMALIVILFGGVYIVYFSIVTAVTNVGVRTAATTAISDEMETIRNIPYDSVGTVGGIPAGLIPQTQNVSIGNYSFVLSTTVRNIDDPFDGTLGGTPNDTAPDDYKLVWVQAACPSCNNFIPIAITTTVAPKNLESATQNGSLFLYVLNANGVGLSGATIQVTNASVTPSVNFSDTTNASGVLELVGVPTSTQNYHISATEPGYSMDQTYPVGASGNPDPIKPNATVAAQTVTSVTLSIDALSSVTVSATDDRCVPLGNEPFTIQGSKTIGSSPTVFKFSTSSVMNASGTVTLGNIEWDTYSLALTDATHDVAGTIPINPLVVDPSSTQNFHFILQPATDPALLVTVVDAATGAGITDAITALSKSGYSQSATTGRATITATDWSGGQYLSQTGGIDPTGKPGALTLLANASGTYATGTVSSLISNTFDLGGSSSTFYTLSWNPVSQPAQTGAGSLEFQVAANNDKATWNFVGPDGTSGSYFTASSGSLPASFAGDRYFRYEVFMSTQNANFTPELDDVSFSFTADCVPPAQVILSSLPTGNYTLDVTAPNYGENSTTISVSSGFQSSTVMLTHS